MLTSSLPTSYVVQKQVPGFVRENHKKFVSFLETYYDYLDQDENINDYIKNVISYLDPDKTTDYILNNFFDELKTLPKNIIADKRFLAKHIYDLYDAKGTPDSIKTLFRILFGEEIEISYPSENILIASDGRWTQDIFITVNVVIGNLDVGDIELNLVVENEYGAFPIKTSKIEYDQKTHYFRIYFNSNQKVRIVENKYIKQYDNFGNLIFAGQIKKSPNRLIVVSGGKFWQLGSIIKIPGNTKDSLLRVTSVDTDGKLLALEFLEYGDDLTENQTITTSPYPNKPIASNINISYTNNTYTIDVTDYVDYTMNINGVTSGSTQTSYSSGDYFSELYSGAEVISVLLTTATNTQNNNNDLSVSDWLAARTIIQIQYSLLGRPRGDWNSDRGKISNSSIRLQDNFYYQAYSYAITTENCINTWKNAIALIHPSGLKYFGEFIKTYSDTVTDIYSGSTSISIV
jgi:hypothetical protein